MKKKNIFFVLLICFINSSCNKEEHTDELQDKDFYSDVTTRASYLSCTITGEMNPYVSDGYYTYDLSIPIQKQSVGIRISAVGGEARFKTNYQERFESTWVTQIPAGKNHFPINVLWTKAGSNSTLMVRPEKSTIELTADLRNINVKMKPMPINAPSTFELGDTITLWCNYSINKDTGIKWTYDKNLFAEVSQSASVTQSRFQINLKSKQAFKNSDVGVEVHDFYINSIGAKEYFMARKSNISFPNMGPQIDGYRNIEQYKEYIYSINDSKAHTFYWTGKNIKIVSGQNSSTVTIVPTQPGNASVKVSYKYKNQTDNFTNELPLSVSKTSMQLIGPDVICDNGTFSIKNFPTKATVDWIVGNDLYSQLNQASPAITLNNLGTPGGSSIYTTLTAIVHTKEYTVQFSKPITFNVSGIQENDHDIIYGYLSQSGGECGLNPIPEGAHDFHWSVDCDWEVDMQGYYFTTFSSRNSHEIERVCVTVDFINACGTRTYIYNYFDIGSTNSGTYSTPKNSLSPK